MTPIEKIKAELEQRIKRYRASDSESEQLAGMLIEAVTMLNFIDSLKENISDDFNEAMREAIFSIDERKGYTFKLQDMFRAGAEYQKNHMLNNAVDGWFDEELGAFNFDWRKHKFEDGEKVKMIKI